MMKKITLLAALFAVFTMNSQVWEDSFETYADFEFTTIGDWTQIDVDGDATYGSAGFNFENETYTGTAIVFNPSMATADPDDGTTAADAPAWVARTGDKGLYMFASNGSVSGTALNDDYIITPALDLSGTTANSITFYAKSLTDQFGLERFEVLLSTTGTAQADFTVDLSGGELQAPVDDYTEYTYDLSAYDGMTVYVAIHYMAQDSFVFQMDDFAVTGTLGLDDQNINGFNQFVDTNSQLNLRANVALENVQLFNIVGQEVLNKNLSSNNATVSLSNLTSGVYIARVSVNGQTETFKLIKK